MAKLGKCLVFYLKYQAEMYRLYWQPRETGDKPSVGGLKDKEQVLSMVKKVGDAALREAGAFLGLCAERIETHLQSICATQRIRRNVEEYWSVEWRLFPKKR